jgi:glycosyltransferase involved in cell wall biosynthesis
MNIGVDIRCLMEAQRTGVGEYTYELLNAVFLQDKENQYYLFYNSSKDVSNNIPKWEQENVHYICLKWPNKFLNLLVWLRFVKLDNLINKKLDYWFSPNLNFTNLSKRVKHIQTIHDLSFEIMPECFSKKRQWWHKFLNPKKQCKKANIILTPSENTKHDVVNIWQISDSKIQVLYPGLSSSFRSQISDCRFDKIKEKYDLPEKYILYLGTLEPRKNIEGFIQAYKQLKGGKCGLIIAGSKGWKYEDIMKMIEKTNGVRYIGYIEEEEKQELYKNSSLFVYPSLYEGFGLPVLEAMACGVPVITSNRSSLPEVVRNSAYLLNPYNVDEITRGVREVLQNEKIRGQIIQKQKKQVEKFSWDKTAEEFIKLICV